MNEPKDYNLKTYELTSPQKSIWLTEQFYKGTNINNICGIIPILQPVNFDKLKIAINKFVENNDSYRIRLCLRDNNVMQYICEYSSFDIDIVQVNSDEELKSIAKSFSHHPFDILDNQLFEFKLFRFPNRHGGFIFNTHHTISDSWTTGITINEIISMYYMLLKGESIDNIAKEESYINYVASEQEYVNSSKFGKDKEYWNEVYKTIPEAATIPSVNIDALKTDSVDARRLELLIDDSLLSRMKQYCSDNKVSLFNFLMSIYSIYIGRVSSLEDFSIGTPILNRSNFKEKHTSGMFINTLPVRIKLNESTSFKEFISTIARDSMSLLRHQKYSYQYLLEDLRKIDNSLPGLFNIMISYQSTKITDNMEEVPHENNWFFNNCIADDIDIHITDFGDEGFLNIAYDYRLNKFSAKDMENIHNRIVHIIGQVLKDNDILLDDIEIVTPEEKEQLLIDFNNTKVDYPKDKTIVQLFEEQVEKNPDTIAAVFEDNQLTYKELNERANQLARYIIDQNIPKNSIVGILLPRSLDLLICIWAILKSDNGYILIDPALPEDRIKYMLANALSSLLITTDNNKNFDFKEKLYINKISFDSFVSTNLEISNDNDTFCVIYTSGSTGNPKGIELKRSSVINLLFAYKKFLYTDTCDIFLSTSTVAFDMFIVENFVSILSGKTVILANEEEQKIPIFMSKLIKEYNVDFVLLTPSKIELLLLNHETKECLKELKIIQLGGEIFTSNLYERLSKYATNARIFNGYGPAECTACCSNKEVISTSDINIGKPSLNTQIYILNKNSKLLPIGAIGEICIAGNGVAKGYINNKELTNKAFVNNLFGEGFLYRTGDLARYTENGELEYIGRRDSQVKLRGLRIELEEITNKIMNIKGVTNAVSIITKVNNIECICSYVVSDKALDAKIIKKYLKNELPYYMIPSHVVFLDILPITLNGKVDVKKLPGIQLKQIEYKEPTTDTQITLSKVWSNLLEIEKISIDYNFFELGGDSLCAIKLVSEIYSKFNVNVTIKDIFDYNTISSLSSYIDSLESEKHSVETIKKIEKKEYYPLSSAQRRIYFTMIKQGDNSILYNTSGGVTFNKIPNIKKLEYCFNTLINNYESLRTCFIIKNDEVVQKIEPVVDFKLKVSNVKNENINELFTKFIKPFNLEIAPLFRAELVVFDDNKSLLLLDMHHIISDGESISIFINNLCRLYNGGEIDCQDIDYTDFAVWENGQIDSEEYKNSESYWLEQFKEEVPILNMPTNFPRPTEQSFEGTRVYDEIKELNEINKLCNKLNTTPYMFLLSIYYILLYKYTNQENIIVGTPVVGRNSPKLNNMIGMFVNTLALKEKINPNLDFEEFLRIITIKCIKAFENQTYPFNELIKKLNVRRDISRNPLFDTMFIYQNKEIAEISFDGIEAEYYLPNPDVSKFDFSLEIIHKDNSLTLSLEFCTKLFTKDFMYSFLKYYKNIVTQLLKEPNTKIIDIAMITLEEKSNILLDSSPINISNSQNYVKPETEMQELLCKIWEQLLDTNLVRN